MWAGGGVSFKERGVGEERDAGGRVWRGEGDLATITRDTPFTLKTTIGVALGVGGLLLCVQPWALGQIRSVVREEVTRVYVPRDEYAAGQLQLVERLGDLRAEVRELRAVLATMRVRGEK